MFSWVVVPQHLFFYIVGFFKLKVIIIVSISLHFPTRKCCSVPSSKFHKVTILKENRALVSHPTENFIYRQLTAVQVTTLTPCTQLTTFTPYCVTSLWIRVSLPRFRVLSSSESSRLWGFPSLS